jgi:hypothetical protein
MKTIQLKGAALEAALNCRRISDDHDKERKAMLVRYQDEAERHSEVTQAQLAAELAIIERETGVGLTDGCDARQLDLRYVDLGFAFVNVDDKAEAHTLTLSQLQG